MTKALDRLLADGHGAMLHATGTATLEAAAEGKPVRKFAMDAYNGGTMKFWWSDDPVVVDLAGLKITAKARPVLKDHQPALVVGHSEKIWVEAGKTLKLTGIASGTGPAAREVVGNGDNGFPWQSSIGADIDSVEEVRAGAEVTVNGQTFTGPLLVVRSSRLSEVSFVALGADDSTHARMTAGRNQPIHPQTGKNVKNHITLSALLVLAAAYPHLTAALNERAEVADKESDETKKGHADLKAWADAQPKPIAKEDGTDGADDVAAELKAARKAAADETRRTSGIRKICAGKHGEIEAKAIEEGWSVEKAELSVLRAARPTAPAAFGSTSGEPISATMLEAAAMMATGTDRAVLEKRFDVKVLEAASKRYRNRLGIQELILEAAWANGYTGRSYRQDPRGVLRAAFALQAEGFSTIDVSGILSNLANKALLEGFKAVDQSWREISAVRPVNDFKTHTSYRLIGDDKYEQVAPNGEIKNGTLANQTYSNKADTYAKMLTISRQDLINDDLGALTTVPRKLGRGAALKLNSVFWAAWLNDAAFFNTDNSRLNYFSGAATNLQLSSLATAVQMFLDQKDPDNNPLGITPQLLLVPTALQVTAAQLMSSTEVRDTTANTKYPTTNVFAGKFRAITSPYLTSVTAWYMLANPADLAAIEVAFLNGQESPTIETAEADFDVLGIQMRGFHDFGVALQEPRAGVKSKGAA